MSDTSARHGNEPIPGSWPTGSGYPGAHAPNQQQYPGYYAGNSPGHYTGPYQDGYGEPNGSFGQPRTHAMTIFAMVVGIVSAVISLVPFIGFVSFALGPVAMVLGIVGIVGRLSRRGFSVTALVTGTFALLVSILYTVLFSALISFSANTQSFAFMADGTAEYKVTVSTSSTKSKTSNQRGPFTQNVDASMLFGGITATNPGSGDETVSCEIYDSAGNLLLENSASGHHATAVCRLNDVLLRTVEDVKLPGEISAKEAL
ncbi:DUF4190 domain-containing protein [Paeniglutamicibacter antarcticus]|uniref:DUF4190 domain-containing protein n=1 Tax=Paeniglutamicibacter antarcticus TaxID=494023 RepID=A0ABP9TFJ1_9MICC